MFNFEPMYDKEHGIVMVGTMTPLGFVPLFGFYSWDLFEKFVAILEKFRDENRTKIPKYIEEAFKNNDNAQDFS